MMKVLLDTNIYSLAMRGDAEVVQSLKTIDTLGFSVISIGELFSGFRGGKNEAGNRQELAEFLDSPRVVVHPVDVETADFYSAILDQLRKAGTPIPTNDIWIAAIAFQHGYKLFSHDRHFDGVPGLVQFQG